jgi:stress response protein YsnF
MASVGHFFRNLFGSDDSDYASHYSEAVRRGSAVLTVDAEDDSRIDSARAILANAGAVDIDRRAESWRQQGYKSFDPQARPLSREEVAAERERVIPVVREELEIGKREVDLGAVRVHARTESRPVEEQVELREQRAQVERRATDRPATAEDLQAFEGGTVEIRETAEKPVVTKTARVVEEVVVGTEASTRTETVSDTVRSTVVDVDKDVKPAKGRRKSSKTASAAATDEDDDSQLYRRHFESEIATGGRFEEYEPAYRYGSTLRSDSRYADRSWDDVESEAERDWTSRNPGSPWERAKAAVRHGWESATGRR